MAEIRCYLHGGLERPHFVGLAGTYFVYQSQTDILYQEQAAHVSIADVQPMKFGTDDAEIVITVRNSGQSPATDFWFRDSPSSITAAGLIIKDLPMPPFPTTNTDPALNALSLAANQQFQGLRQAFDATLDIDDQHPTMPSESDIRDLVQKEKALGKWKGSAQISSLQKSFCW